MSKITITSLSKKLGVSISTVNKALNGKSGVSDEKRREIIQAAENMGYKANRVASSLARRKIVIGVVLPNNWSQYHECIREGIYHAFENLYDYNVVGLSKYYSAQLSDSGEQVAVCFQQLSEEGVSAIIFCPGCFHRYDNALQYAAEKGLPVVVIGIESSNLVCLSKIEVNADLCGRLAAEFMEGILTKESGAAIIIGSRDTPPHVEKLNAFAERLKSGGKLKFCGVADARDNNDVAYLLTKDILNQFPKLEGIYSATSLVEGICRAIVDSGRIGHVKVIATDIYPQIKDYMDTGLVVATIYQNTYKQGMLAVELLNRFLTEGVKPQQEYRLPPILLLRENFIGNWQEILKF